MTEYSSTLSLDGVIHLIDNIRRGRIWCPSVARTDHLRWVDSAYEEIPEEYDILTLADLIMTYEPIEGNGFRVDPEGHTLNLSRIAAIDTEACTVTAKLDPGLCRDLQEAMEEAWRLLR